MFSEVYLDYGIKGIEDAIVYLSYALEHKKNERIKEIIKQLKKLKKSLLNV